MNTIGICVLVSIVIVVFLGILFLIAYRIRELTNTLEMQNRLILILLKKEGVPNVPDNLTELDQPKEKET